MKKINARLILGLFIALMFGFVSQEVKSQTTYYSTGSTSISTLTTWNSARNGSGSTPGSFGSNNIFIVESGDVVTLTGSGNFNMGASSQLTIESGGEWNNTNSGTITIGTFRVYGGGIYRHDRGNAVYPGSAQQFCDSLNGNNGNGTVIIKSHGTTGLPAVVYGNLTIDWSTDPGQAVGNSGNLSNIKGNLTVSNTQSREFRLTAAQTTTHYVGGNLIVNGGFLSMKSGAGNVDMNVMGNVSISAGTLSFATSSAAGNMNINIGGDFSLSGTGTFTESNAGTRTLVFAKGSGSQAYDLSGSGNWSNDIQVTISTGSTVVLNTNAEINSGETITINGTLNCGANRITKGSAAGSVQVNGTLITSSSVGLTGNAASASTINTDVITLNTLGASSTVHYNGTSQTVTSLTYNNLTVSNAGTRTIGGSVTVGGILNLQNAGSLLSIGANTLTLNGTITGSGFITGSSTSNLSIGGTGALGTLNMDQTTPGTTNLINNFTLNRTSSGALTQGNALTVGGVLTLTAGNFIIGANTLALNGTFAGTGTGSLQANGSTSNLAIGGSGAFGAIRMDQTTPGTTNRVNNFTFNRSTSGTLSLSNALQVLGVVTHTDGVLTTGGSLTLAATSSTAYGQIDGAGVGSISDNVTGNFILPASTNGKWRGFSSPFTGNTFGDLADDIYINYGTPSFLYSNVYLLNEADCGDGVGAGRGIWQAVSSASQSMDNQGFSVKLWDANLPSDVTVDLAGTYTNGDYTTPTLSFTNTTVAADSNGWHLIRQPWPSNYNHNTTINNLVSNTIYVYEGSTVRDWNGAAGSITNGIVPPYHAMLVKVSGANTLTFPNTNRTASNSNSFLDKTSLPNYVALKVTNPAGIWDETRIYSDNNADNGKDLLDAKKVLNNADAPTIYTMVADQKTSINLINNVPAKGMSIPVAFTSQTEGVHTMSFTADNVEPSVTLYLEDLKDKKLHKIENGNYTFTHTASNTANRFVLHFNLPSSTSVNETAETALFISSNGNNVNVSFADAGKYTIEVFDVLGRSITTPVTFNNAGNSMETVTVSNVTSGYYFVKVTGTNGVITAKVFLN